LLLLLSFWDNCFAASVFVWWVVQLHLTLQIRHFSESGKHAVFWVLTCPRAWSGKCIGLFVCVRTVLPAWTINEERLLPLKLYMSLVCFCQLSFASAVLLSIKMLSSIKGNLSHLRLLPGLPILSLVSWLKPHGVAAGVIAVTA